MGAHIGLLILAGIFGVAALVMALASWRQGCMTDGPDYREFQQRLDREGVRRGEDYRHLAYDRRDPSRTFTDVR